MTNTKTELKEIAADLNRLIDALQAGGTRSVVGRAVDRLAEVILTLSNEPPDCPKCGVAHYPNCEQVYQRAQEVLAVENAHEPKADCNRVLRNLLREYCAVTKLEPWSHPDWQCEEVVRQAVRALGLNYGDKL